MCIRDRIWIAIGYTSESDERNIWISTAAQYNTFFKEFGKNKDPVSYTHLLDELKQRLRTFAQGDLEAPFPAVDSQDEIADMVGVATVSYTHLDVYKRQQGSHASRSQRGFSQICGSRRQNQQGAYQADRSV